MTKHTLGPWRVNPGTNEVRGADWNVIVADAGIDVDARLIAAAPDLLEALEAIMATRSTPWRKDAMKANGIAIAALAKAKGMTP